MIGRSDNNNPDSQPPRSRRSGWIWLSAVVVALLVIAGGFAAIAQPWSPEFRHGGLTVAPPPSTDRAVAEVTPARSDAPAPTAAGIAAALAPVVGSPDLGAFAGQVTDPTSGTVLWSQDPAKAMIPSSTAKVMLVAAALLTLPDDQRIATKVVAGAPGELVLVAGGDPTLTTKADGGYYTDGPRIADLAAQIKAKGTKASAIVVDNAAFVGPTMAPGWDPVDIPEGSISPIEPVMLDGGRFDPSADYSPRTATPALDAGRALAAELGIDPAAVRVGPAERNGAELARVESAPLRVRLHDMMIHSDNVLAETIGRELALATGLPPSFAGAVAATTAALTSAGFDVAGLHLADNSGLSVDDRVPPRLLDSIIATAAEPTGAASVVPAGTRARPETDPRAAALAPLLDDLPVAGGTGTLAPRFVTQNRAGAGWVRAKTGTLSVASALVGYVLDRDGRVLTFALMSNDRLPEVSRPALDAVAGTLRNCGCS
ncbi:D-alanyl-D-alanine carboxypeptidase/D-alanyl-D-alanine-endopeptidase [Nocardia asteroides]|uniref:D-alanyl-D-alanine carboxypeptidase n=1 Tax=Nocardia asteroides NBRC 15531 TaxID=1110697 RepID=U5EHS7_NOCAS|nr:D-alanyl-D-alanine carboxypeptidase [Nocardia asteroides NBRC 15531]GAD84684.1 D-alanyl-D-alanine carboxypeptidase [Nocardia asteroides NBRC 15531]SFN72108.1 D-alanyl-D-alanine carboxypeptidase / D-alanyl-D-alanine-endopeptidase (penicillin-binding protein 4) [Nocardia asteroides]VEG32766.1 D-alanyl-D-alanine carboxypeptidase dacB precursor [Nocardia asteroides]